MINNRDFVEDIIEENIKSSKRFADVGIKKGQIEDYVIVVRSKSGKPDHFEISKNDLYNSLIGVEVYDFEHEIID